MIDREKITESVHAFLEQEAKRAGHPITTDVVLATSGYGTIAGGLLREEALEEHSLANGSTLFIVNLSLRSGVDHTVDGTPLRDGSYLVKVQLGSKAAKGKAMLLSLDGHEVGPLQMEAAPSGGGHGGGHQPIPMAAGVRPLSASITRCSAAIDVAIRKFVLTVSIKWC